ncbi:imm11 family protein, partial [Maritalea sp.]|uniref:imm11 family protein n=1 Tax=Maritalea sp. TaxID=2003361 RepID=UPI0039E4190F
IRWGGGKRDLGDFQKMASHFLVSVKLRDLIEELEPGVHQFQPIELIWKKDESHAADFFWFNPCNRVDGIDRTHSTAKFDEKTGKWKYEGGEFVVNLEQVAGHHIWVDSRASFGTNWVSEAFYNAAHQAGIKGIKFTIQKVI